MNQWVWLPSLLPGMLILCASAEPAFAETPTAENPIVVVGKRPQDKTPLDDATPQEQLPAEVLAIYGANSVGELLERLKQQEGDPPPEIVVNGRRLGSLADLAELPAEAVASIQIFSPSEGRRFGLAGRGRLYNVVLQKQHRGLTAEAEDRANTDGGRHTGSMTGRAVRLNGNRRLNGAITAQAYGQLRAAERPVFAPAIGPAIGPAIAKANGDGEDSETGRAGDADRSLLPRSRSLAGTFGLSVPMGSDAFSVSAEANLKDTSSLLARNPDSPASIAPQARRRLGNSDRQFLSASWDAVRGYWFLNLSGTFNRNANRSRTLADEQDCSAFPASCRLQDISTQTTGGTLTAMAGGPALRLPSGPLRIDLYASYYRSWTSAHDRLASATTRADYDMAAGRANVAVPLVDPASSVLGWLGQVELTPSLEFTGVRGTGHAVGNTLEVNWTVIPALRFYASLQHAPSLPSDAQLNAITQTIPGANVYDYRAGGLVAINQLVGGAALRPQESRKFTLSATYSRRIGDVNANFRVNYANTSVRHPQISLTEPSALLEREFPERFLRDAQGALILVDTRPFNADRSITRTLSASLRLMKMPNSILSRRAEQAPPPPRTGSATTWIVDLGVDYAMEQSLTLKPGMEALDLLSRPLSVTAEPPSRWTLRATGKLGRGGLGGDASLAWKSAMQTTSQSGNEGVSRAALATVDVSIFHDFAAPTAEDGKRRPAIRLKLAVTNLFNARPDIRVRNAASEIRLNPWILDPEGRVAMMSLRIPLASGIAER